MATYSQSITAVTIRHTTFVPKTVTVSDEVATLGAQQLYMQQGTRFLAQGPGGQQSWYRLDAERSTPGNLVLVPV